MRVSVDGQEIFALTELQKKVIKNDIMEDIFEEDMKRRLEYILTHKYEQCFRRLKEEWEPKLRERYDAVPTKEDALASLIFSQPDYKNRSVREAEEIANRSVS